MENTSRLISLPCAGRWVKRRQGRRALAKFENLTVNTQVYELRAEERACPCSGVERKEIDSEEMQQLVNLPTWPVKDLDAWLPDRWKQEHFARCEALGIPVPPTP